MLLTTYRTYKLLSAELISWSCVLDVKHTTKSTSCWYISYCSHNSWINTNDTKVTKYSTLYNNHTVGTCNKKTCNVQLHQT